MRVLHIALTDSGGAGMGMMNLHHALLAQGIDSRVLVAHKRSDDERVVEMQPNLHLWARQKWICFLQRAVCRMGICLNDYDRWHHRVYKVRKHYPTFFTQPFSQYDILNHPLAKRADIIHLHFAAEFVDYSAFFPHVKQPVVWTVRDESPGLGGFHFQETEQRFYAPYASLEEAFMKIKREAIESCHTLHLISLSPITRAFCQHVDYLASRPNTVIPNAISAKSFQLQPKATAKQKLKIPPDAIVLSFVSYNLNEERKGLSIVIEALRVLNDKRIHLLCVGKQDTPIAMTSNVHYLGLVSDTTLLSTIYSASDFFVNASSQETFGKTLIEALYCGTPVITTPVGIAPEVITPHNGRLFTPRSAEALAHTIKDALTSPFQSPSAIRQETTNLFCTERVAQQHIQIYSSLLKKH